MAEIGPEQVARVLREVQALDSKIFALKRDIEGLPEKYRLPSLEEELREVREAEASTEKALADIRLKQDKLDGELNLLVAKMKKEEEKLFSGTIMNPKELSAIQEEIFSLRKRRDEMETEDLEEMEEIDTLEAAVSEMKKTTVLTEEGQREAIDSHDSEKADKEAEIAGFEFERDELKKRLDPELTAEYEKLLANKGGIAVVPIMQGRSCGGCRIDFSRTQIDEFQHNEGVFRCEYCRRILVKES